MNNIFYDLGPIQLMPFDLEQMATEGISTNWHEWMSDQEVTKYNSHGLFPESASAMKAFQDRIANNELIVLAIIENRVHVGNVSLQRIDWINRSAEFAIVMGEHSAWGKGYATMACRAVMYHGFTKLNLNRIWSGTAECNKGMRRVFSKLGMMHEGTFREGTFLLGEYYGVCSYSILEGEHREMINRDWEKEYSTWAQRQTI